MKKLFAILLAMVMLCSFAAVGASAATPEEEAWAAIEDTQKIFASGQFTVKDGGTVVVKDGDRIATETNAYQGVYWSSHLFFFSNMKARLDRWITGALLGEHCRFISTSEGNYLTFPEKRVYAIIDPGVEVKTYAVQYLQRLWPTDTPDKVTYEVYDTYTYVTLDWIRNNWTDIANYSVRDGKVSSIYANNISLGSADGEFLSPQPNQSYFSLDGMKELPWWLMKILTHWAYINYSHEIGVTPMPEQSN